MQPRIFAWSQVLNNNQKVKYFSKLLELMTLMMIEGHYLLLAPSITSFYWLKALEVDYHGEGVLLLYRGIRGNCTCSGVGAAECHWQRVRSFLVFRNSNFCTCPGWAFPAAQVSPALCWTNHWVLGKHSRASAQSSPKLHWSAFHSRGSLRQPGWVEVRMHVPLEWLELQITPLLPLLYLMPYWFIF